MTDLRKRIVGKLEVMDSESTANIILMNFTKVYMEGNYDYPLKQMLEARECASNAAITALRRLSAPSPEAP